MLTVGELLKKEREKQGLTLKQVEKNIKIREKFLSAVEANDWSVFSSKVYITGIIRNYARFLELDGAKLQAFFRRDYERQETVQFKKRVSSRYLIPESRRFAFLGLIGLFILFFGYFGFQLSIFLSPPKIVLVSPKQDRFFADEKIKIIGKTDKDAQITIFGERVYQNKDGIFEYDFPLKQGENTLIIEVTGANGKQSKLSHVYLKE
ncbi:hypothetical protein HGA88_06175 [Candidatus Roizmanbacteria bacterium]|nr:hypothetical protein [Candidatus Roizmanbacteria bacterium]